MYAASKKRRSAYRLFTRDISAGSGALAHADDARLARCPADERRFLDDARHFLENEHDRPSQMPPPR